MASGKARSIKRASTSSSYSSATTIVVFVGLSVLGLWLLTSNSFAPPQSKTPTRITSIGRTHHHSNIIPQTRHNENVNDDPSSLSDPDPDPSMREHSADNKADEELVVEETKIERDDPRIGRTEAETKNRNDKMPTDKTDGEAKIGNDETQTGKMALTDHEEDLDHPVTKGSREYNAAEEQEKQAALETQTSEEISMTLKEHSEEIIGDNPHSETNTDTKDPESNKDHGAEETTTEGESLTRSSETTENQMREEDEQNQQGGQEVESKDPNGVISNDQTQHDEAPVHPHQEGSTSQDTDEPNEQTTNQEPGHDSLGEDTDKVAVSEKQDEASNSDGDSSEISQESSESKNSWSTQANQSDSQNERAKNEKESRSHGRTWLLCNVTAGTDYIPCLDNEKAVKSLRSRMHHQHRERHCPEDPPTCLVALPHGYKRRIDWPQSRDKIWYNNVPHTSLVDFKGHQNWMKVTGEFLVFPGGGTQFIHGALHYIDFIRESVPDIAWGKHTRVVLDVGCGVASFGGYMFERDVLTMSFAPKDEHEAQVQFALERGIPAISAVMGSQRLPFPSRVFDVVHCARCRVPWHADGGALLLELNRVLRPGGYFVWSATPVYQKLEEDVHIWKEMSRLTVSMCWELITIKKDKLNSIGAAIYQKPDSNDCYERRKQKEPVMCKPDDDPNASWYIPLQSCMHPIPTQENERGSQWPEEWPERLQTPPYWLNKSQTGIYGKPAPDDFIADYEHWKKVVSTLYMNDMGINWSEVRNVMDMRAVYGGFAAALMDQNLWVMNVVNTDSPDTLPIIYDRGLFGIYHDWCESFSTYPRTYDLLHADHLFSRLKKRCKLEVVMAEIDRILRPGGKLIMRDESSIVAEVEDFLKSLHWEVFLNNSNIRGGILGAQKSDWRPTSFADPSQ